jgi:hypothetical protein
MRMTSAVAALAAAAAAWSSVAHASEIQIMDSLGRPVTGAKVNTRHLVPITRVKLRCRGPACCRCLVG